MRPLFPGQKKLRFRAWQWAVAAMLLIGLAWSFGILSSRQVRFEGGTYRENESEEWAGFEPPMFYESGEMNREIRLPFSVGPLGAKLFSFRTDNCLKELEVNDETISSPLLPFCEYNELFVADLSSLLHEGLNEFWGTANNEGGWGYFVMRISAFDRISLALLALVCLLIAMLGAFLSWSLGLGKWQRILLSLFVVGVLLRVAYFHFTPYEVRSYDVENHIDYVAYPIYNNWSIPPMGEGKVYYQPPLYYFLSAAVLKAEGIKNVGQEYLRRQLQSYGLLLSVLTLALAFWIGTLLFPKPSERASLLLYSLILTSLSGFVFFAARVNNDVLAQVWLFLAFGFLLRWWRGNRAMDWYAFSLASGLGMLTKFNILPLILVAGICLLFRKDFRWKEKFRLGAVAGALLFLIDGWYLFMRFREGQRTLIPNLQFMDQSLHLETSWRTFFAFHPLQFILIPFNNVWNDSAGRQYFFEFFYRSWFSHDLFNTTELIIPGSVMQFFALAILPFIAIGFISLLRGWRQHSPLLLTAAAILAGFILLRLSYPYASSQDFRYCPLLVVPFAAFAAQGIERLKGFFRILGRGVAASLSLGCFVFLLLTMYYT